MERLSYSTLKKIGYSEFVLNSGTERMLQFGEGNFLRAFVDYFVDVMNEKADFDTKIVVCQPIEHGLTDKINEQEGLYTLFLRGFEEGNTVNSKRLISSISRCINPYKEYDQLLEIAKSPDLRFISCNTTEAGIVFDERCRFDDAPPASFPAKLTRFMYERFSFNNNAEGFIVLSCELIDDNGKQLQKCVLEYAQLWVLGSDFISWIKDKNIFCSTLVDRIVTGYPRDEAEDLCNELGYRDELINTGETFGFWVIEGPESLEEELPFKKAGLPVIITDDHSPYKQRKVRILNGAHTSMVLGAYLCGKSIVRECMQDNVIRNFINSTIYDEIIPTLSLPKSELEEFAKSVEDRFSNPYIDHSLLAIALNSTSKWKARVLPSLISYIEKYQTLPERITASFAFYIEFYRKGVVSTEYKIEDDAYVIDFYKENCKRDTAELVSMVCRNKDFWGVDLSLLDGFEKKVAEYMNIIDEKGAIHMMELMNKGI